MVSVVLPFLALLCLFLVVLCLCIFTVAVKFYKESQYYKEEAYDLMDKNEQKHLQIRAMGARRKALRRRVLEMEKLAAKRRDLIANIDDLTDIGLASNRGGKAALTAIRSHLMEYFYGDR